MWITISFAIRNMSGIFPGMSPLNPETSVCLSVEGALWFTDLTATDPYYLLPFLLVASNMLNIEVNCSAVYSVIHVQGDIPSVWLFYPPIL